MKIQFKDQRAISISIAIFAICGLLGYLITYKLHIPNIYIYSYFGILLLSLIGFFTSDCAAKNPNYFYLIRFLEAHFIAVSFLFPRLSLSSLMLIIVLLRVTLRVKGDNALKLVTIFLILNYVVSAFVINIINPVSLFTAFSVHLFDIIAMILGALFLFLITKDYDSTFQELEKAHAATTMNNQLLNNSIAELSTLQEISKFANSILNIKELINIINDAIIGVIGVNYCSIFLIDESDNFYLESTNIQDKNVINSIKVMLNSKYLQRFKSRGETLIEGSTSEEAAANYPYAESRGVKTFLISPLQSHRNFLGLIVVESCFAGVFEERKKNMLNTICNQVSIAIENAVIYQKMERLATIDGLTQVRNRRYFNERCLDEFSVLNPSSPLSIAMIDIDNFKKINDTYGHMLGDSVLKKVASIVQSTTCAEDSDDALVARYGGEEFVVLLKNTNLSAAYTILEAVRKNIESAYVDDEGERVKFTVSIGIAEYPKTSKDVKEILRDADIALYKAKETGKNRVITVDTVK